MCASSVSDKRAMFKHLTRRFLARAGLAQSERESQMIHYRADYDGMRRLLSFLIEDCCQQRPEMCADLVSAMACKP
jgi:DNA-binding transcriptional ArsR family regulator